MRWNIAIVSIQGEKDVKKIVYSNRFKFQISICHAVKKRGDGHLCTSAATLSIIMSRTPCSMTASSSPCNLFIQRDLFEQNPNKALWHCNMLRKHKCMTIHSAMFRHHLWKYHLCPDCNSEAIINLLLWFNMINFDVAFSWSSLQRGQGFIAP